MTRPTESNLPAPAETAQLAGLGEELTALAESSETPARYVDRLLEQQKYGDAARYLAFALPKREAVWWACRCARLAPGSTDSSDAGLAAIALEKAERWVIDPTEENRRAAGIAGEAAVGTPASCAALGAFWSGGSLAPPGLPEVPAAPDLTARSVAGGVMLAGVISQPEKAPERYRAFHDVGLAIADGADRWQAAEAKPVTTRPQPVPPSAVKAPPPPPPSRPASSTRSRDTWE